ncbi:MAG: winged helix-turn-helix transcriptional regulator [Thaumarchaeota archaeon]|nr:winged helix-turn-helix transcriptional regulator [Nitrososphaerota archaeon]
MYSEKNESIDTRRWRIIEYIKSHPGTHLRKIKRDLGVSMGVVQYHLYTLEREKRIISQRRGLYKRFYPNLVFGEKDRDILNVLSQETEREILLFLIAKPNANNKEISQYAKISAGATTWHMKRLLESGLIQAKHEQSFVRYSLTADSFEVMHLVKNYHTKIWERWADRLADTLGEISNLQELKDANKKDSNDRD